MPPAAWVAFVGGGIGLALVLNSFGFSGLAEQLDRAGFDVPGYSPADAEAAEEEPSGGGGGGGDLEEPGTTTIEGGDDGSTYESDPDMSLGPEWGGWRSGDPGLAPGPTSAASYYADVQPSEPITGGGAPEPRAERSQPSRRHRRRNERERERERPRPTFEHPERGRHDPEPGLDPLDPDRKPREKPDKKRRRRGGRERHGYVNVPGAGKTAASYSGASSPSPAPVAGWQPTSSGWYAPQGWGSPPPPPPPPSSGWTRPPGW